MTTTNILTVKIDRGRVVLAKKTQFGIHAVSYVNMKQATKKVEELRSLGIDCFTSEFSRIKYIFIK